MKLLYIVNARIPTEKAHGIQIMKMCEAFTKSGVDLTLVLPRRFGVNKKDPFEYYGVEKKFPIIYLPILDIYELGYVGFMLGSFVFSIVSLVYGLYKRFTEKEKVIFYSRDQDQFSFFPFFLGLKPFFFEVHGLKNKGFLHNNLFNSTNGIIATNSFIQEKLLENFPILKNRVILLPNGVDIDSFDNISKEEARKKFSLPQDKKIILYAGHFYKWKGVDVLVHVAPLLDSNTEVYMVGGRDEDIKRLRKEYPIIPPSIKFTGFQPYTTIPNWYAAADALVITGTIKDRDSLHYTSPIKLFEYMATNRPIIAVNTPAVKNIVSEKEVSFYESDNENSLSGVIKNVLKMDNDIIDKINKAKEKVGQYSWQKRVDNILQFIKSDK